MAEGEGEDIEPAEEATDEAMAAMVTEAATGTGTAAAAAAATAATTAEEREVNFWGPSIYDVRFFKQLFDTSPLNFDVISGWPLLPLSTSRISSLLPASLFLSSGLSSV